MADMLIESLTSPFHPAKYTDDYRQALHEAIRAKVEGRQIYEYREPETARVIDLMEALRASVEMAQATRGPGGPPPPGAVQGPGIPGGPPPPGAARGPGGPGGGD